MPLSICNLAEIDVRQVDAARKRSIRNEIREKLDVLEAAAHDRKKLTLSPDECAAFALALRRIQDEAARDLGYA